MAIKGKGRTRARQVARPPRRAPVEVPKPLFQRTWVRVIAAALLGALAVMLLVWITNSLRASDQESDEVAARERRQDALATVRSAFESQVATVGQIQDPLGPVLAPQIREAADALAKGKDSPLTTEELEQLAGDLETAATTLEDYDLTGTIRDQGFNLAQTEALIASRAQLVAALRELEQAAGILLVAVDTDDPAHVEELATTAVALADSADLLAANGWRTFRNALQQAGLVQGLDELGLAP